MLRNIIAIHSRKAMLFQQLSRVRFVFSLVLLYAVTNVAWSQDIHFSQFDQTPMYLNPALTGIFKGDIRFALDGRTQWYAADAPYSTLYLNADKKFLGKDPEKSFFNGGLSAVYDRAADVNFTGINFGVNGSYARVINPSNVISVGAMLGFVSRQFDLNEATFDSQFQGGEFNPGNNTNEAFNNQQKLSPDLGVGINWYAESQKNRNQLNVGFSAFHLHRPDQAFKDDAMESRLEPRLSVYLLPVIQLTSDFDLVFAMMAQKQKDYFQSKLGINALLHLNQERGKELAIQAGAGFRFNEIGDAIVPRVEVHYQYWEVGFSYDLNVSEYRAASNRNGGPELTIRHYIHEVRPPGTFKQCPLL